MKENKTVQIKFRLTENQKKQIEEYAEVAGLNVSEVMRLAITELLNKKQQYDGIAIVNAINEATKKYGGQSNGITESIDSDY